MDLEILIYFILAGGMRFLAMNSQYKNYISERVEISTPLNSWERATEAGYLHATHKIDPYSTDIFHDTPLNLEIYKFLIEYCGINVQFVFIFCDILTSIFLFLTARGYMLNVAKSQAKEYDKYHKKSHQFLLTVTDFRNVPFFVLKAYLFHPFNMLNCIAQTTTVFTNLLLSIALFGLVYKYRMLCYICLAFATCQTMYPSVLVIPFIIQRVETTKLRKFQIIQFMTNIVSYSAILYGVLYLSFNLTGNWQFLNNTFGFILNVTDLRPNIGTTWYFFTEMFEHFRLLFIWSLQINVTILYLVPLALKFRKEPLLLAFALIALTTMFRSYPCIGDVGFYLSLLPIWKHLLPFMQQRFIICCIFIMTSVIAPIFWHLWIYSGAANANFYFGVTLAFTVAQIFVLTDMLFAYINRQYILKKGCLDYEQMKKYKLMLY